MRILIVCTCPILPELGLAQGHLNLAAALRKVGHEVMVWSPLPVKTGMHWAVHAWNVRANLRAFLRREPPFDVVDCPPVLVSRAVMQPGGRWIARSTQPDVLYGWETLRGSLGLSSQALARTAINGGWWAFNSFLTYRGMSAGHVILCHGAQERAWIAASFPWLRPKLHTYEAAISDDDRSALARVRRERRERQSRASVEPVRYLWIGRWTEHKGIDLLTAFLSSRIARSTNERFTIAGCGREGERALAALSATGCVRVVPSYRRADLPELLAAHDAGLFTSRAEGWGLVLNEMVESGLPVYATRAGGVDEIRSVLGAFVPEFPPAVGAQPPSPPGEEVFARYGARFRWDAVAERYLRALGDVRPGGGRVLACGA